MRLLRNSLILLILLAFPWGQPLWAGIEPVRAPRALVASVHEQASQAGVDMLRAGGNAIDAAVATGFALAVVHPQAGNLGGGGFMLVRFADGSTHFLDFRERAPAAAVHNMYLDAQGNVIKDASVIGYRAIAVPGSVAGLTYAQNKWGKLPLARVMVPAIRLAREGFTLNHSDAKDFRDPELARFPESRRIFQRDGRYYAAGEVFRQPELARTLERIARKPDEFYRGALARELAAAIQKGGGLVTATDLAAYEVKEREPVRGTYRGYQIISAPPPSSGGIALIEALNILEGYDLASFGSRSAEAMHLTLEAFRRSFYDRAEFLGDSDFAKVPVAQLIDKHYGRAWRESLDPDRASLSAELRRPSTFSELDRVARLVAIGEPDHTTHYSVVDAGGNAVAVTTTLNDTFGSRVTAPGLGFLLNDEMDDFTSKPGAPNMFGLIQGEANCIAPGKRPLSAMTPTVVLTKENKLFLVLGARGGPRIITTVANILMGVIDYGLNLQEAVSAPRFHHQWLPDEVRYEKTGFSPDTLKLLRSMGHNLQEGYLDRGRRYPYWRDAPSIAIDLNTGERLGAQDPRGDGKAIGY